jgi:hypothetical protein
MPSTSLCLQPPNLAQGRDLLNSVPEDASAEIKYLETSAEPACDGCGGTFQTVARRQVPTVRKRRTDGRCDGGPGGRAGSGSVRSTTLDTLAEQNRCQVGPTILFDRPRAGALQDCIRAFWCLRWIRAMMMLSARSRMNLVFLSGEPPRVLGHYLASILVGCDGGVCKP